MGELADGVIVGSRVVRAAGEGGAEAVGELVGELAAALAETPGRLIVSPPRDARHRDRRPAHDARAGRARPTSTALADARRAEDGLALGPRGRRGPRSPFGIFRGPDEVRALLRRAVRRDPRRRDRRSTGSSPTTATRSCSGGMRGNFTGGRFQGARRRRQARRDARLRRARDRGRPDHPQHRVLGRARLRPPDRDAAAAGLGSREGALRRLQRNEQAAGRRSRTGSEDPK